MSSHSSRHSKYETDGPGGANLEPASGRDVLELIGVLQKLHELQRRSQEVRAS